MLDSSELLRACQQKSVLSQSHIKSSHVPHPGGGLAPYLILMLEIEDSI